MWTLCLAVPPPPSDISTEFLMRSLSQGQLSCHIVGSLTPLDWSLHFLAYSQLVLTQTYVPQKLTASACIYLHYQNTQTHLLCHIPVFPQENSSACKHVCTHCLSLATLYIPTHIPLKGLLVCITLGKLLAAAPNLCGCVCYTH